MFTARYGLSAFVTQIRFLFNGLNVSITTKHFGTFYRVLVVSKYHCIKKTWTRLRSTGTPNFTCNSKDKFVIAINLKAKCRFHVATILLFCILRRKCLTLRRLMSYIYGAPILDVSRSHTTTQHSR